MSRFYETTTSAAGRDGQSLINPRALDSLIEALDGKPYKTQVEQGFRFKVALYALNNGVSLTEIIQRATCQVERYVIRRILSSTEGNKAQAARILKIDYKTLYRKMQKYVT